MISESYGFGSNARERQRGERYFASPSVRKKYGLLMELFDPKQHLINPSSDLDFTVFARIIS